ncbi:MAG: maleylpyruvate isomerase family mycothiol-dependent enzyme [Actinobacteria bacterium]|nr:maleylpyruvate isomerase family mycothiol-dependent enzyme [Actinomycetota bacterium]
MQHRDYLPVIEQESAWLADALRAGEVSAPVPSCPGWTIGRLVKHTGTTHRWADAIVERRSTEPVDAKTLDLGLSADAQADARQLADWFERGAAHLTVTLAAVEPDVAVWSWAGRHHASFWSRRMAQETAVHRWDGEAARGEARAIAADLAVDGIDERFDNLPATMQRSGVAMTGEGETVHLHCTDRDGEWLVRLEADGPQVTHEHAKGDVAARGPASDVLLLVYGRVPPDRLEVFGDVKLLRRFQELAKL